MIWNKLPFNIVLIATVLPWVAAFFDAKWITYIPISLGLLTYFMFETPKNSKFDKISYGMLFIFLVIYFSVSWQLIQGIGIGSGGTIITIILTFIYFRYFTSTQYGIPSKDLIKQIHIIYVIHIIFILCELVFRLAGGTELIVSLVGNTTEVMKYKMYNKARFLRYIGFSDMTGLGGLLLGSQSASQVAIFAVFLFAPFYKNNPFYQYTRHAHIWFFLSIMAFLASITMMSSIIATILLFIVFFYLPTSKYKYLNSQIIFIITLLLFFNQISQLVLFNIKNAHDIYVYYNSFISSIKYFFQLDPITQIFGLGKHAGEIMHSQIDLPPHITLGDFGFGMLLNQAGILLIGFSIVVIVTIFIKVRSNVIKLLKYSINDTPWAWIGTINSLLALGWLLSLIHYTPAVELGGRELFAFHLAVSLLSIKNMRLYIASEMYSLNGK